MGKVRQAWRSYLELWNKLSGWKLFFFYLLNYTVLFFFLQLWIFADFYQAGKSFMWTTDGLSTYFPRLVYISQTVRDGIQDLLGGRGWTIPLFDFRMGPHQTDLEVEPIQWLAVLWPWDKIDILYDYLVLLRYYFIGVSFSAMGFYFRQKPLFIAIGAVSYTFCGFSIFGGVKHPSFMTAMILLPLLIIGAEKLIRGERAWLFTGIVVVSLIYTIYFSCMLAILIVVYIFIRYCCTCWKNGIYAFGCLIGRMALWGGLGILLGGAVWVPTLLQMMGTGRIGRDVGQLLHYSKAVYEKFFTSFIVVPEYATLWSCLGFSVLVLPAIVFLFLDHSNKRENRCLRVLFLTLTAMICSPFVAYVMSGFNAPSARWCFAYALCVSTIIMFKLPELLTTSRSILLRVTGAVVMYIAICYFIIDRKYYYEEPLVLLGMAMLCIFLCHAAGEEGRKKVGAVCLALSCLSAWYGAFMLYDTTQGNYVAEFVDKGSAYTSIKTGQYASMQASKMVREDDSLFYVAGSNITKPEINFSFYGGLNGLSFYSSSMYPSYRMLSNTLEMGQQTSINMSYGIDGRVPFMALMNVKYYVLRESDKAVWPYGMREIDRIKNGENTDIMLENEYALGTAYTYDTYVETAALEGLSGVERQEIMLQSVVLDVSQKSLEMKRAEDIRINAVSIPIQKSCGEGITWEGNKIVVSKENATLNLTFEGLEESDTYLRVINLASPKRFTLWANTESTSTWTTFTSDSDMYGNGAKTQLLYLGNSSTGYTTCTLTFPQKGTFALGDLEIWCQPMDHYAEQIEALRAESLENVETNWRGLTGTISTTKDKFLCFSIPYDKGWTAYVDGEKADLMQANIGFMGIELPAGNHDIELKYWPSGMTAGIVISCVGVIGVVGLAFWEKKKKKI